MRVVRSSFTAAVLLGVAACGTSTSEHAATTAAPTTAAPTTAAPTTAAPTTAAPTTAAPTTAAPATTAEAFTLTMSPERVNRFIPGERPLVIVGASGASSAPIALSATTTFAGATVRVAPSQVTPQTVAEVWITIPEVTEDVPFMVTITGTRGAVSRTLTVDGTATPGVDDVQATALDIAAVFLKELQGKVPGLPADRTGLVGGTPVAGLLVVTHYAWFTDAYELDLGWHIMVAPNDWAELDLRPRTALTPTKAYKLSSWSTALAGGQYTVTETTPPDAVFR